REQFAVVTVIMPVFPPIRCCPTLMLARAFQLVLLATALMLGAGPALAQSGELLKVTDAFRLTATSTAPGKVALDWKIADHYYLYRNRVHVEATGDAVELGTLQLPPGQEEHDPYLVDVFIFHHQLHGTQPYSVVKPQAGTMQLAVTFQGCHEVDPKICYPRPTARPALPIVADAAAATPAPAAGGASLVRNTLQGAGTAGDKPLPPEQAFRFSVIATGPDQLLLRWSMPKGYYLYRDKTQLTLVDGKGITLGTPQWPTGVADHDACFGSSIVYFDEVDVPLPDTRDAGSSRQLTRQAKFQGCQKHGICYPVMTRKVTVDLPAAAAAKTSPAGAASTATA